MCICRMNGVRHQTSRPFSAAYFADMNVYVFIFFYSDVIVIGRTDVFLAVLQRFIF